MTVDESSITLDTDVATHYLALTQRNGGRRAAERTALRTRSRTARDLFAAGATDGQYTCDALVRRLRDGTPLDLTLDRTWTLALSHVVGMQNLDEGDLDTAVLLLKELRRQHGSAAFSGADHQAIVDRLWQVGAEDLLRSWQGELRRIKPAAKTLPQGRSHQSVPGGPAHTRGHLPAPPVAAPGRCDVHCARP